MLLEYKAELHLSSVARLHSRMISYTTIAQMGEECLYHCYQSLSELDGTFGFVWVDDHEKLVGFSMGTMDSRSARKAMFRSLKFSDKVKIVLYSIGSIENLLNIIDTVFVINPFASKNKIDAEWLAWITDIHDPKSSMAALETYKATRKYFADQGITHFWCQADKRTKTHKFLSHFRNIHKKSLFQNYIFTIKTG